VFDQARIRRTVESSLADVFAQDGYREVAPSSVEYIETYTRGNQHLKDEAIKYLDRNDRLLALRADFTPAIARIVASRPGLDVNPLRLWYAGSVFRKVGIHRGRFCEFRQIGAELIGEPGNKGDASMIDLAFRCLKRLGIDDAVVHVNHAGIFRGVVQELSTDVEGIRLAQSEIDRKDARGLERRLETLGIAGEVRKQVHELTGMVGGSQVLEHARATLSNQLSQAAVDELELLARALEQWAPRVVFDLSEVDEMEYYTGMMCTVVSPRSASELGKGGRYDTLLREFGSDRAAVGFSFSLDTLVELL
jgi:ATP phosphoribosyltransferase regulatory subunit